MVVDVVWHEYTVSEMIVDRVWYEYTWVEDAAEMHWGTEYGVEYGRHGSR